MTGKVVHPELANIGSECWMVASSMGVALSDGTLRRKIERDALEAPMTLLCVLVMRDLCKASTPLNSEIVGDDMIFARFQCFPLHQCLYLACSFYSHFRLSYLCNGEDLADRRLCLGLK